MMSWMYIYYIGRMRAGDACYDLDCESRSDLVGCIVHAEKGRRGTMHPLSTSFFLVEPSGDSRNGPGLKGAHGLVVNEIII